MMVIRETIAWRYLKKAYHAIYNSNLLIRQLPKEDLKKGAVVIMVYSLYGGGSERVACLLANGLSKMYPVILIYSFKKEKSYSLSEEIEAVIQLPPFRGDWEFRQKYIELYINRIKKLSRPAASISMTYSMNRLNVRTKVTEKVICCERNNPIKKNPEKFQEIENIYTMADHVVFQSVIVQKLFNESVQKHSTILPNPVVVSCSRADKPKHRIVNVGRLHPQKNQKILIKAFFEFSKTHPEYTLSFYGEGDLREELENYRDRLGLGEKVIFHGNIENVQNAISDAEMFVLSSDYEGFSNALLESMIMGIPCISTACEGSVDAIQHMVNGILTKVGDAENLSDAMTYLADNPNIREEMGKQARKVREKYLAENAIPQWIDMVERI